MTACFAWPLAQPGNKNPCCARPVAPCCDVAAPPIPACLTSQCRTPDPCMSHLSMPRCPHPSPAAPTTTMHRPCCGSAGSLPPPPPPPEAPPPADPKLRQDIDSLAAQVAKSGVVAEQLAAKQAAQGGGKFSFLLPGELVAQLHAAAAIKRAGSPSRARVWPFVAAGRPGSPQPWPPRFCWQCPRTQWGPWWTGAVCRVLVMAWPPASMHATQRGGRELSAVSW
jgi:hypothetical protein